MYENALKVCFIATYHILFEGISYVHLHKMLQILVLSGKSSLESAKSSESLGIPSRTSNIGKQVKTLKGDGMR